MSARTPFDRALELLELRRAADVYASRHGEPGSAAYRAAWLRFRQRILCIEDLQRMRASSARAKSIGPKASTAPANRAPASPIA
jgi:hypothetical protein